MRPCVARPGSKPDCALLLGGGVWRRHVFFRKVPGPCTVELLNASPASALNPSGSRLGLAFALLSSGGGVWHVASGITSRFFRSQPCLPRLVNRTKLSQTKLRQTKPSQTEPSWINFVIYQYQKIGFLRRIDKLPGSAGGLLQGLCTGVELWIVGRVSRDGTFVIIRGAFGPGLPSR